MILYSEKLFILNIFLILLFFNNNNNKLNIKIIYIFFICELKYIIQIFKFMSSCERLQTLIPKKIELPNNKNNIKYLNPKF